MEILLDCVRAFHCAMDNDVCQYMGTTRCDTLVDAGLELLDLSKNLEENKLIAHDDKRFLRAHLLLEELGEFLVAAGEGKEADALDGLTDLLYVLLGTAVTFDWPLLAAFAAVHASNMTKERQADDPAGARVRQKGENYVAPDIEGLLTEHYKRGGLRSSHRPSLDFVAGLRDAIRKEFRRDSYAHLDRTQRQVVRDFITRMTGSASGEHECFLFAKIEGNEESHA